MRTLIVAEIGINHNGSIDTGRRIVDAAHTCGCGAVKFQTYEPTLRFKRNSPFIPIFQKYHLPFEEEALLWRYAADMGLKVITTPFDKHSVENCRAEKLDGVKIASFETTNLELVRAVSSLNLPTYVATGQNTMEEVKATVSAIEEVHEDVIPMHCISSYPMDPKDANLRVINRMREELGRPIGFSDHSPGHIVAGLAVAMGAICVEKHFTIDNTLEGPDHSFSMNPVSMKSLVNHILTVEEMLGDEWMGTRECEAFINRFARRVSS